MWLGCRGSDSSLARSVVTQRSTLRPVTKSADGRNHARAAIQHDRAASPSRQAERWWTDRRVFPKEVPPPVAGISDQRTQSTFYDTGATEHLTDDVVPDATCQLSAGGLELRRIGSPGHNRTNIRFASLRPTLEICPRSEYTRWTQASTLKNRDLLHQRHRQSVVPRQRARQYAALGAEMILQRAARMHAHRWEARDE